MGLRRIAIACLCAVSPGLLVASAATQEILENGGFEEGASAWSGAGISTNGCTARSGSKALAVSALLQQNVPEPMGAGDYTMTGWLMAGAGSPDVDIALIWLGDGGASAGQSVVQVQPGDSYAPFELRAEKPHDAESARVRLAVSGDGTVCLDDISLQGPPRPTATPVPTETPTTRPQPTSSATPPPSASLTVTPTPTATLTPEPTSTAVPSPGFILVNGGFEDGVEGWRKYGGELRAVSQPRYSGVAAGELYSYTDSTKWAYQTLRIDDSLAYEFSGYVRAGPGVSRAYLRISWYESSDGSGRAISTIDSTSTAEAAGDFVFLTTGPVAPPPGARSARPRVMMTPLGAGAAAIHFDDLSFTLGLLSTATPQLTATSQPAAATDSTPTPESTAIILRRPATQAVTNDDDGSAASATTSPSAAPLREVRVQRYQPATPMGERLEQPVQDPSEERAFPVLWIVAGGLVVLGLGGNYVHGKRRRG